MIGRILLTLLVLAVTGFMVLVLIGLQASRKTQGVISERPIPVPFGSSHLLRHSIFSTA